ncbi:MAG: glycosyltransferase family 39 protein [Lentisphaeria bacterium]|nr:glycosyltransferase family 39 protein [Lentisphaeria bacterium]
MGKNFAALFRGRPERVLGMFIAGSMIIWTLQCSLLQNILGIDILETVLWGSQPQWGYSKHPPLSGWIGGFFARVTGHSDWGLYLAAQIGIAAGVWFTYLLARQFFCRSRAATAALLLYFLFYYTPSEMKFSTYFVEMAIAPAASYFLLKALRGNRIRHWLILGVLCGLGILNKYSFALVMLGFAVIVLTRREYRVRLKSAGPFLSALTFLLIIMPHLLWLAAHDFICLNHVDARLGEDHSALMPLFVLATALYPPVNGALVLLASRGLGRLLGDGGGQAAKFRRDVRPRSCGIDRDAMHFATILTLLPGAVYFLLALTGTDIILMWMCSVASWSGIMVVSACPAAVNAKCFRRVALLLAIGIAAVFTGTTIHLLCRTSSGIHPDPHAIVSAAERFWHRHSAGPIPLAVGNLRYAALIHHYAPDHPPACECGDEIMVGLNRARLERHGALLIAGNENHLADFLPRLDADIKLESVQIPFRARFGRTRLRRFVLGFIPPGTALGPAADAPAGAPSGSGTRHMGEKGVLSPPKSLQKCRSGVRL